MSEKKIYIYHTNDIHSNLTYWPRLANELVKKREMREQNGDFVLAFDIGDASDRVHPLTEATDGRAITSLLNEGKYDAVTIGNNEGITNSKAQLNQLYQDADFSVILMNLFDKETGERPQWAEAFKIYDTSWGDRIGVFGLTTPLYNTYDKLGWKVTNPVKETQEFFKQHHHKADFWILLSHLGIEVDRFLSKLFPIPLIIGAHSHHVLQAGEKVAASTLAGAGQFGQWLGEITIGRAHNKLSIEQTRLFNSEEDLQAVANEMAKSQFYTAYGHQLLQKETLASIPQTLKADWYGQSSLADIALEAIADFTGTEAALLNAGLFMADIPAGTVTADELHQTLPHPIRVMRCEMKGTHLIAFIQKMTEIDERMMTRPVRGYGFRGRVFGKMCMKGISICENKVYWQGKRVQANLNYQFAAIDYFSFLPIFDILNTYSKQEVIFPDFIRTVVGNYLAKEFPAQVNNIESE